MCCQGDPTKFQELLSPQQQALRNQMISGISSGLKQGATPYGGAVSAGVDPMSLMAANVMMGIGTGGKRGYTAPNFYGMQGGTGTTNPWGSWNVGPGTTTPGTTPTSPGGGGTPWSSGGNPWGVPPPGSSQYPWSPEPPNEPDQPWWYNI
jgi:hypothetical protein